VPDLGVRELINLRREGRTWPDETHRSGQHIEELRQLVDAGRPEEPPDAGDTGVVRDLEERAVTLVLVALVAKSFLCVNAHRPQLEHHDRSSITPDALLGEQGRPPIAELDHQRGEHHEWSADQDAHDRTDDVEPPLRRGLQE
jgi:hypothetical protein